MNHISFDSNLEKSKNAPETELALACAQDDPEFRGVPRPTEQEAAEDIQKRIEELRALIQSQ
jgi:hypothetical protein